MKKKLTQTCILFGCFLTVFTMLTACQSPKEPVWSNPSEYTTKPTDSAEGNPPETETVDTTPIETEPVTEPQTEPETKPVETQPIIGNEITVSPSCTPSVSVLDITPPDSITIGTTVVKHQMEIDLKDSWRVDDFTPPPPETMVVQVGDISYPGTYDVTASSIVSQTTLHQYIGYDEDGLLYYFKIHAETGRLMEFNYPNTMLSSPDPTPPVLTAEECRAIVDKFITENYGWQQDEYLLESVKFDKSTFNGANSYLYDFRRIVNGMPTEEWVRLHITVHGRLTRVFSWNFGNMDGVTVPDYDEDELLKSVEHKLYDIYKEAIEKNESIRYQIEDIRLLQLHEEGKLHLVYYVNVYVNGVHTDYAKLLACIE